ncbi:MAG: winged helix-turn-helix transcriptional regulator [Calditrichaeota bacterium]|nr:winged helix-turn-helix transcriptional regulator [Calditrichota bacterium]
MVTKKKPELEAHLLEVLAQSTRLKILYFLKDGERCACEITPKMREDASVISRHLVKMREAGILGYRKEGVSIYYWIKQPRVFKVLELIDEMLLSSVREKAQEIKALL